MPTSIPPFDNVPAPGDLVKSAWASQLTQYAVDHVNDASAAHPATAVSFNPTGTIAATTVQAAIAEVASDANAGSAALDTHVADTADAHDASAISFIPNSEIAATNVQAAILEAVNKSARGLVTHQLVNPDPPTTVYSGGGDQDIGPTVTWTADPTRRYKTTVAIPYLASTAESGNTRVEVLLWKDEGGTLSELQTSGISVPGGSAADAVLMMLFVEPPGLTGTQVRKLTAGVNVSPAATVIISRQQILVEDIGGGVMTTLKSHPQELDLALYAGDGITLSFTFVEGGNPWPTAGAWAAEIRSCELGDVITSFNVTNDEPGGVVTLSLSGEQVRSLGDAAYYDLQQTAPGAEPRTWYRGKITIEGDVTRG